MTRPGDDYDEQFGVTVLGWEDFIETIAVAMYNCQEPMFEWDIVASDEKEYWRFLAEAAFEAIQGLIEGVNDEDE